MKYDKDEVLAIAKDLGLDPFPVDFHVVPAEVLYDVAARAIPGRYSHWSHGKQFYDGLTRHDYRFSRIYELVINTNPCQAFLLDVNSDIINLMVVAHVYGHSDFFKNNIYYKDTDRDMHESAARRAERVRYYEGLYGEEEVRKTLDDILTVEFYVDPMGYDPAIRDEKPEIKQDKYDEVLSFGEKEKDPEPDYQEKKRFAGLPTRDILHFLWQEAPLEDWKKDLMSIVRADGLYFWPMIKTKIANEGHASFFHSKIMHKMDIPGGEFMEYAEANAKVVSAHPYSLNPYWLGNQILKDVEEKHGLSKVLEIRRLESDASLIRNYLTEELVEKLGLYRYKVDGNYYKVKSKEWEEVRNGIVNDMCTQFPEIEVVDKNYDKSGTLLLRHNHDGRNLKKYDAVMVLRHLENLWQNPVYLETRLDNKPVILKPDGGQIEKEE